MKGKERKQISCKALRRGRVICIPGFKNRVLIVLARMGLAPLLVRMLENRLRTWLDPPIRAKAGPLWPHILLMSVLLSKPEEDQSQSPEQSKDE